MYFAVVRVLLVYLAFALITIGLARRFGMPLSLAASVFVVLTPLCVTGKAVFTGSVFAPIDISYQTDPLQSQRQELGLGEPKNPVLGDVVYQEIPWRKAVREAVKNGRFPLWNRFLLGGEPLLAMMLPAVLHPFTWAGMLLPLPEAWTLEMTLGVFLALLASFLLFLDWNLSPFASALGAAAYAFSDYLRFYAGWPLSPAAAAFPLLLLGLGRLARAPDYRGAVITTVALYLILNAGHPESALHAVAGGSLWFLFCLARQGRGARTKAIALSFLAGLVTLGLTAVVLLPHLEALGQTWEFWFRSSWWAHQRKSLPLGQSLSTFQQVLLPYAFGLPGHGEMMTGRQYSQAYVGSVVLPFVVLGTFAPRRERWALLSMALVGFGAWAHLPVISDAIAALPLFDLALNERLVFLGCFALAALGALGLDALMLRTSRSSALALTVLTVAGVGVVFLTVRGRLAGLKMPPDFALRQLAFQLVPATALASLLYATRSRASWPRWAGALVVLILVTQRITETDYLYPAVTARAFYPKIPLLSPIDRTAPYRMGALGNAFIPNVAAMYEIEDIRGYETMTFRPFVETYPLWCTHQSVWFNRIDDPTRPFLAFLNVRYIVAPPGDIAPAGWRTLTAGPGGSLFENPRVLPRAFAPREVFREPVASREMEVLGEIEDFSFRGVVRAPLSGPTRWKPNGPAHVNIVDYRPEFLGMWVIAERSAIIGTSIPAWKGWRIAIDGTPAEILVFNHAFLGINVAAGRHHVELRYLPMTAVIGLAISALSLGLVILVSVICHRASSGLRPRVPPAAVPQRKP